MPNIKYNQNDSRHVLVKWLNDNEKYSVLSMNKVEILKKDQLEYELGGVYWAKFGKEKYKATFIFIGTQEECIERESAITSFTQNTSLKGKVSKTNSNKVVTLAETSNREQCRVKLYESEIESLKEALKQKDDLLKQKDEACLKLEREISKIKSVDESKEKLLLIATSIFNNFATRQCLDNLNVLEEDKENGSKVVQLSCVFPDCKIDLPVKQHLIALSKNPKVSSSSIFKDLVKSFFTDPIVLGNMNVEIFKKNHTNMINAFRDFMVSIRPEFNNDLIEKALREICSDSRQKVWRTNDSHLFVIEGKELRKSSKKSPFATSSNKSKSSNHKSALSSNKSTSPSNISAPFTNKSTSSDHNDSASTSSASSNASSDPSDVSSSEESENSWSIPLNPASGCSSLTYTSDLFKSSIQLLS